MTTVASFQGCRGEINTRKTTDVIHHIHGLKGRDHKVVLGDAEKAFSSKTQHPFTIQVKERLGMEGRHAGNQFHLQ